MGSLGFLKVAFQAHCRASNGLATSKIDDNSSSKRDPFRVHLHISIRGSDIHQCLCRYDHASIMCLFFRIFKDNVSNFKTQTDRHNHMCMRTHILHRNTHTRRLTQRNWPWRVRTGVDSCDIKFVHTQCVHTHTRVHDCRVSKCLQTGKSAQYAQGSLTS